MYGYVKHFYCGEIFGGALVFIFYFFCWWGIDLFGHMIFGCEQVLVMWVLVVGIFFDMGFLS